MPNRLTWCDLPADVSLWPGLPLSLSGDEVMPLDYRYSGTRPGVADRPGIPLRRSLLMTTFMNPTPPLTPNPIRSTRKASP